jgi:hypothetical protein
MQHSPENVHSALPGRRPGEIAGLLAGLAGVVIFGLTLPMTHFALAGFDVYTVGLGRGIAAACLAGIVLAATRQPVPPRIHWGRIFAASAGIVMGFPLLVTAAMQYVPSAMAASSSPFCRSRRRWRASLSRLSVPRRASGSPALPDRSWCCFSR